MKTTKLVAVLALAGLSSVALAQNAQGSAPEARAYGGFSLGGSSASFDSSDFAGNTATKKTKTGGKLFLGYDFNKNWAIEGGYVSFGKPTVTFPTGVRTLDQSSWYLAGKGTAPINEKFGLFAKLGISSNRTKMTTTVPAASNANETKAGALFGIGAEYAFSDRVGLVGELESYGNFGKNAATATTGAGRTKEAMGSIGLSFKFF
jgi:OOP family OmpA-OmpF porin